MPRAREGAAPRGREDSTAHAAAGAATASGNGGMVSPELPGEARTGPAGPSPAKGNAPDSAPPGDGPETVPLPGESAPAGAGDPAHGEPEEGRAPGQSPGIAI